MEMASEPVFKNNIMPDILQINNYDNPPEIYRNIAQQIYNMYINNESVSKQTPIISNQSSLLQNINRQNMININRQNMTNINRQSLNQNNNIKSFTLLNMKINKFRK
jgi:hypothetical protein